MKQVILIRHAKSDQHFWGNDFERPLNDRGKADAYLMSKRLMNRQMDIDAWISSPAKRARKTAEIFTGVFGLTPDKIDFVSALYHAPPELFDEVIRMLPDELNSVALFSHNPGISYFVNALVPGTRVDNMPTCGIFAVSATTHRWLDFSLSKKQFLFFDYPKKEA